MINRGCSRSVVSRLGSRLTSHMVFGVLVRHITTSVSMPRTASTTRPAATATVTTPAWQPANITLIARYKYLQLADRVTLGSDVIVNHMAACACPPGYSGDPPQTVIVTSEQFL